MLPVVTQHVDTDHRITDLGHLAGHITVQVAPAAITRQEQRHGAVLLACRHFNHRHVQPAVVVADQNLAQFVAQYLREVNVIVADAGLSVRLITYESSARVVRVVVPGHQPAAVCGRFRHGQRAARLLKRKTHRHGLGLVVGLLGQPAPGQGCARADAANQRRRAFQLLQCRLQGLLLQGAVFLGQNDLYQLRFAATAQRRELSVSQGLFGRCCNHHLGARGLARCHFGQGRAIGLAQVLNRRLRGRAIPEPIAAGCQRSQYHQN